MKQLQEPLIRDQKLSEPETEAQTTKERKRYLRERLKNRPVRKKILLGVWMVTRNPSGPPLHRELSPNPLWRRGTKGWHDGRQKVA